MTSERDMQSHPLPEELVVGHGQQIGGDELLAVHAASSRELGQRLRCLLQGQKPIVAKLHPAGNLAVGAGLAQPLEKGHVVTTPL